MELGPSHCSVLSNQVGMGLHSSEVEFVHLLGALLQTVILNASSYIKLIVSSETSLVSDVFLKQALV